MDFKYLLDVTLGEREIFYVIECSICGFDEIYYKNPQTKTFIGRACATCNCVQQFKFTIVK